MRQRTRIYLAVGAGGAIGSVARWAVSLAAIRAFGPNFPFGTLAVNVIGSFVIGFYFTLTEPEGRFLVAPAMRQFVLAGLCGGFTTFSIFSLETLFVARQWPLVAIVLYAFGSVVFWLLAVWFGHRIALHVNRLRWRLP